MEDWYILAEMIYSDPLKLIGNTPLVKLVKTSKQFNANFYVKLEKYNLTGSVKDRAALGMIEKGEREGVLRPGMTLIESSSGNLGIAIAAIASIKGYKFICVIDPKTSPSKISILEAYGGKIIRINKKDKDGSYIRIRIKKVKELLGKIKNSYNLDQYNNPNNTLAHFENTGPEIFKDLKKVDVLVGSLSTSGTMVGTAKFLKEKNPDLYVVGVEPLGSVLFGGEYKPYYQQGPGASFLPGIFDISIFNKTVKVKDKDAFKTVRNIIAKEAIFIGGSSGAAIYAAIETKKRYPNFKNIVIICPDGGDRYLDTIFSKTWLKQRHLI